MRRAWILLLALGVLAPAPGTLADDAQTGPGGQSPTPEEIETLRRQIQNEARSSVELLFGHHTENGDVNNRLDFERYGTRLKVKWGRATALLSAARTSYATIHDVLTVTGTNVTLGVTAPLSERIDGQVELGATHFTTDTVTVSFLGVLTVNPSERGRYSLTLGRSNVEESLLSAAGIRPVTGPFAGDLVGAVMENRLGASGRYRLPARFDVFGEAAAGARAGSHVASNFFKRAGGGAGYNLLARAEDRPLSLARLSASVYYFGFNDDRFGFGGASLLDKRYLPVPLALLGSDGLPTAPSARSPGVGGYFSPRRFVSRLGRIDVRGRPRPFLEYRLELFAGSQSYTGSATRGVKGISANVTLRGGDRLSMPVSFGWDDVGPFRQQTLAARLLARF